MTSIVGAGVFPSPVPVQEGPWDPNPFFNTIPKSPEISKPGLLDSLYNLYQAKISDATVHRCPFGTSCSSFAVHALRTKGLLGVLMTIDRMYFRENNGIYSRYDLKIAENGVVKVDDDYFLGK